jgi:hypothetical protein
MYKQCDTGFDDPLSHFDLQNMLLLFTNVRADIIMLIVECLLNEFTVIMHAQEINLLTPICEGLLCLISPFLWE